MKFAICDDMLDFTENLKLNISKILEQEGLIVSKKDCYVNGCKLLDVIGAIEYDAVFLDIEMPNTDGFMVAQKINEISPSTLIIFVTNREDLVYESFDFHPYGFIRKTHLEEELPKILNDIIDVKNKKKKSFVVRVNEEKVSIDVNDIYFFESARNEVIIHTEKDEYRMRDSIVKLEKELVYFDFVRTHNAFLVNSVYLYSIGNDEVKLKNNQYVPVSRTYKKQAKQALIRKMMNE